MTHQRNQVLLRRAKELLNKVIIVQSKTARDNFIIGKLTKVGDCGELTVYCLQEGAFDHDYFYETDSRLNINNVFSLHELDDQFQNQKTF